MKNPTTIALVEPFAYQPFHSIRQLCGLMSRELTAGGFEVVSLTPAAPFSSVLAPVPHVQRVVSVIERLTLSPALLRAELLSLEKKARQLKRDFVVLLSDQSLGLMAGALRNFKCVCFVSDLISLHAANGEFSQATSFGKRFVQNAALAGLNNCEGFITPSHATAQDIERFLPNGTRRTTVAPLTLASTYTPLGGEDLANRQNVLWRTLNQMPRSYVLHVGSSAWYKNRMGVLHLMAELKKAAPASPSLVFAGASLAPEEKNFISEHVLDVVVFQNLGAAELNALYSGAEALLMPSYIEGFGWPALEALACGTPLVITDTSSLAEHFSAAATLILPTPSPENLSSWAIEHLPDLQELLALPAEVRAQLTMNGLSHAARFTPENFRSELTRGITSVL